MDRASELWKSLQPALPNETMADQLMPQPRNPAMPADWAQNTVRGLAGGLADFVMAPRRAMDQGITTEEAVPWGGEAALAMAGAGSPAAARGALGAAGGKLVQPAGIRAYHGSPHDFDRFDLSRIGTGEGAQSYGHGLYFAEAEPVAKAYRDALGGQNIATGGKGVFDELPWMDMMRKQIASDTLRAVTKQGLTGDDAIRAAISGLNAKAQGAGSNAARQQINDASNALGTLIGKDWQQTPGRMYEVNINAKPEQFLDWDKPLAQQPIADTVRGLVPKDLRKPFDANVDSGISGANAYHNYIPSQSFALRDAGLREYWPSSAKTFEEALQLAGGDPSRVRTIHNPSKSGASEALREVGIPGIKYLDQGSRLPPSPLQQMRNAYDKAEPAQTSNYVVFDDKLIDILRKYGLAGMAPAAGAAAINSNSDAQ